MTLQNQPTTLEKPTFWSIPPSDLTPAELAEKSAALKRCSGTQFDPVIVSAFLLAYEKGNIITNSNQRSDLK